MEEYQHSKLYKIRHTAAHVLAMAALEFDPKVKLAIGPPIETGFYYDFEFSKPLSEADLPLLELSMEKIIKQNFKIEKKILERKEALEQVRKAQQDYKVELIEDLSDKKLTFYGIGDFWDLCKGPHAQSTGEIKAFKLLSVAGAYWRGNEHNQMLTRVYGTAFETKKELDKFLAQLELAKKNDHRRLGRELGIFTVLPAIGSGLPVWLPKGATLYRLLLDYVRELEASSGYQHVISSVLGKKELYQTSGHLDHYQDSMYPPIELDGEQFILRPMNCPHHISIFADGLHSYKELPIRLAEFGQVFRYEKSGELSGLQRVRSFTINDAHIFCTEEQIKEEVGQALNLIKHLYHKLEIKDYWLRLSLRGESKDKYGRKNESWQKAEKILQETLKSSGFKFVTATDEAAFYGPKIDVQMKNIHGKEETISTVQLDFYLPEKFKLEYIDDKGQKRQPVMIHRAILGSMERFIGIYLEKTGGEFPVWLAPVQIRVLPISDKQLQYAQEVNNLLKKHGYRSEADTSAETLGKKIRQGETEKIPYLLIIGEKERQSRLVTVRQRHTTDQPSLSLDKFLADFKLN